MISASKGRWRVSHWCWWLALGILFLAVLLPAITFGPVYYQYRIIESLRERGITVRQRPGIFDRVTEDGELEDDPGILSWLPYWLQHEIRVAYQPVALIDGARSDFSDGDLALIASLTDLEDLWIDYTDVSDAGLRLLAAMPNLESLDVRDTRVTLDGVQRLRLANPRLRISWSESGQKSQP